MKQKGLSLRTRMLLALAGCFVPMLIAITLLFGATVRTQQQAEAEALCYTAQDISTSIDRYVEGVYSVSDAFSTDERLLAVLDRDYGDDRIARQYAIIHTNGAVFESYARLVQNKQIDAVYVVRRQDVLDFLDVNQDVGLLLEELTALGVDSQDKLGRFYFYPLRENFLTTGSYGEVRRDHVVLGSRRVYSALKSGYPYVHLFAIEEQMLYELYAQQAEHRGAQVYVLDAEGGLISSTDEQAVAACAVPENIARLNAELTGEYALVPMDGRQYAAARHTCGSVGWTVLILSPGGALGMATSSLYLQTLAVILICVGLFAVLVTLIYRWFMAPLAQLEEAMHRADLGDLRAYVKPRGTAEMVRMMEGYNAMLDGIRIGMEQRMQLEQHKQDLEMQVLMSQINPHFLYNTLETIVWKASEAGRSDIARMASSLGRLYRLSIAGGLFVPLQKELEHVRMYMNIQQNRYGNKVAYDVRLHGCDAAKVQVLKLILQPVVENCFLYGMEGLDRTLRIRVSARRRGGRLALTVTDNGVGMDEAALAALAEQIRHGRKQPAKNNRRSTGIGLHNIYARLQLYAGSSSEVQVWSLPGIGTQVTLLLPWQNVEPPEEQKKEQNRV